MFFSNASLCSRCTCMYSYYSSKMHVFLAMVISTWFRFLLWVERDYLIKFVLGIGFMGDMMDVLDSRIYIELWPVLFLSL